MGSILFCTEKMTEGNRQHNKINNMYVTSRDIASSWNILSASASSRFNWFSRLQCTPSPYQIYVIYILFHNNMFDIVDITNKCECK